MELGLAYFQASMLHGVGSFAGLGVGIGLGIGIGLGVGIGLRIE